MQDSELFYSMNVVDVYWVIDCPPDETSISILRSSLTETIGAFEGKMPNWGIRFHILQCRKKQDGFTTVLPGGELPEFTAEKRLYISGALSELTEELQKNDALSRYYPIVIFGAARFPHDDFIDELYRLKHNKYYDSAVIIGFAFGDSSSFPLMKLLCKYEEAIVSSGTLSLFSRLFTVKEKNQADILVKVDPPDGDDPSSPMGDLPADGDMPGDDGWD